MQTTMLKVLRTLLREPTTCCYIDPFFASKWSVTHTAVGSKQPEMIHSQQMQLASQQAELNNAGEAHCDVKRHMTVALCEVLHAHQSCSESSLARFQDHTSPQAPTVECSQVQCFPRFLAPWTLLHKALQYFHVSAPVAQLSVSLYAVSSSI